MPKGKRIYLRGINSDKFTLVDAIDFEWLNKYKWWLSKNNQVCTSSPVKMRMHRLIMNCPKDFDVDHINRNPLDNRWENLRICTRSQNLMNRTVCKSNKIGVKGVSYFPYGSRKNRWRVNICIKGKKIAKYCATIKEAKKIYKQVATKYFGEYACY